MSTGEAIDDLSNSPVATNSEETVVQAQVGEAVNDNHRNDALLEPGFHRLDRQHIKAEIITGTIVSSIFSVAGLVGVLVAWFGFPELWQWSLVAAGVAVVLLWLWYMTFFWPFREYKYASWKLDDVGLEIRKGVLWRHRITVPRARIQHVDVSQGPLQRNFGLGELTIHTAGTQNSSVKLEGLAYHVAIGLRDELISKREPGNVI